MESRIKRMAVDLLFPPRCVGCGELLPPFAKRETVFCALCRTPWETAVLEGARLTEARREGDPVFLVPYRSGHTDGVPERLIYHLKHEGESRVFGFVAERLSRRLIPYLGECRASVLFTYPPRRRSAVREDGFDQAERLARKLAEACGGEFKPLLTRTRRGRAEQKTLNAAERQVNASLAYTLPASAIPFVRGRTVVLCDDLFTTGATLKACADLLTEAGTDRVLLVTVARTVSADHTE